MSPKLKRIVLRPIPYLFSDATGNFIAKLILRRLKKELAEKVTDKFLESLLAGMDVAFSLSESYQNLFRTANEVVAAAATFKDGDMEYHGEAIDDWDVRVTFKDYEALNAFLFSKDQDILDSVLANDVEVDGNLNYIYKFGFMVRDLGRRLGIG
jgi:hypothetical protein